ncbi:Dehydrogenases with different specificities (related to short-chain alcohol dehydrogenases) [Hyphomicrobiales bacterium]|nr:Dehydrogenases with different specificities (related to short-chain alcohol dehydrogenases) [Hyphomicrobiales bacterium]CAH1691450.1 Dehydrogenases with different specificities (related to short-chain alcohol dehydrogenases) [Hyphomicrobiales bacterium]
MTAVLRDRVAIVTGGGRGIGRAIALKMAAAGARVVVNDLGVSVAGDAEQIAPADEVVREIRELGGEAVADKGSVTDWDATRHMVATAVDTFGRLDIVVNNAGIIRMARIDAMSAGDWHAVTRVHLAGSFNLSRAAAPVFRSQKSGAYVHMTSASGLIGSTSQANYAAAKLGIVALSKAIALDMAAYNVRSNCIAPSSTSRMTELTDSRRTAELSAEALATLQKSRAASQPDQMAPLVVYLASDLAHGVNGQVIGARGNELYLYSQHRPIRVLNSAEPWTAEKLAERLPQAWSASLVPLDRITDVFRWAPI